MGTGEQTIKTFTILEQIQALSSERQQLWRAAHLNKFSPNWWKRHNRIEAISKQLVQLWHMRRVELAGYEDHQSVEADRINGDHFADYREHVGWYHVSGWRIEDETAELRRYMTVAEGLRDNQYAHVLKNPTKRRSTKPNVGARQRRKAALGMIQLS